MATLPITSGNINLTDVQDFFNISRGGYPATGGVALTDLGSLSYPIDTFNDNWSAGTRAIQGVPGWTITQPDGTSQDLTITNNTGATQDLTNGRLDVDLTITTPPADFDQEFQLTFGRIVGPFNLTSFNIGFEVETTSMTITATDLTVGEATTEMMIEDGAAVRFRLGKLRSGNPDRLVEFRVDAIRLSLTQDAFVPIGANLADYTRDGGIVPATSSGGGGPGVPEYPTTGGFAVENLGSTTLTSSDTSEWPADPGDVVINGDQDISYGISTASTNANFDPSGAFTNNGSAKAIGGGNIRVGVRYSNFTGSPGTTFQPIIWSEQLNLFPQENLAVPTSTETVFAEFVFTVPAGVNWGSGVEYRFVAFDSDDRPYDFEIAYVRWNFEDDTPFERVGTFPETGGLALTFDRGSEFRILDATASDVGWSTAAVTLAGATTGWTYTPEASANVVSGQNNLDNILTNGTGAAVDLGVAGRIDVEVWVSNLTGVEFNGETNFNVIVRPVTSSTAGAFIGTANTTSYRVQDFPATEGPYTITLGRVGSGWNIPDGGGLRFAITETDNDFTPFTIEIRRIRISFTNDEFIEVGTGGGGGGASINEGISETVNGLNLNQFYGVDDGEA